MATKVTKIYESKPFDDLYHVPIGSVKSKAILYSDGEVQFRNIEDEYGMDDAIIGVGIETLIDIVEKFKIHRHKTKGYNWLPNWYATRLHAVGDGVDIPTGCSSTLAVCGVWAYGSGQTDWAKRRIEKGLRNCKNCEKIISKQ